MELLTSSTIACCRSLSKPVILLWNPQLDYELEVSNGLYECIKRLTSSLEEGNVIMDELPIYKSVGGLFGSEFAISQREVPAPSENSTSSYLNLFKFMKKS